MGTSCIFDLNIARREPSEKVKIVAQNIGFVILLTLMVFVIFNDVLKYF